MSCCEYKPKPIKGLKIEYNGTTYDKVTYMSCSNDGLNFEHMPNESTQIHINCKMGEANITLGGDK